MDDAPHIRLRLARARCGFLSASAASAAFAWNANTYAANENGHARFSRGRGAEYARAFGVEAIWLMDGVGPMRRPLGPGVASLWGTVGGLANGRVTWWGPTAEDPGAGCAGLSSTLVLLVTGEALRPLLDTGGLVSVEPVLRLSPVTLVGHLSLMGLVNGEVRLGRVAASRDGLCAEPIRACGGGASAIRWGAAVTGIAPPLRTP